MQKIQHVLDQIASDYEVISIDDGSSDGSVSLIQELAEKDNRIVPIYHKKNKGLGRVLRTGYLRARYENVISIPGDDQFDPAELIPISSIPPKTFIAFYRKEKTSYNHFRNAVSQSHKRINKFFIGLELKDVNWAIAFKTTDFDRLNLELHSTLIKSEICAKLLCIGYSVNEVESVCHPRSYGEAKGSSLKILVQAFGELLRLSRAIRKFKRQSNV